MKSVLDCATFGGSVALISAIVRCKSVVTHFRIFRPNIDEMWDSQTPSNVTSVLV